MNSVEINENHRRSLASVLKTVEQRLKEFGKLVAEAGDHPRARFSVEQTQDLFERIAAAQRRVDNFRSRFKIPEKRPRDPGWAIQVGVASLWELLEDSKSAAMRGYGEVPEATKPHTRCGSSKSDRCSPKYCRSRPRRKVSRRPRLHVSGRMSGSNEFGSRKWNGSWKKRSFNESSFNEMRMNESRESWSRKWNRSRKKIEASMK